jgi:hypothetical protein
MWAEGLDFSLQAGGADLWALALFLVKQGFPLGFRNMNCFLFLFGCKVFQDRIPTAKANLEQLFFL